MWIFLLMLSGWWPIRVWGQTPTPTPNPNWFMAGANPQRTSWVSEEVSGNLFPAWYRPIEAYIDQKTQVITSNNKLYIATANGLVVLNAGDGSLAWRYDTQLPLSHSPTVYNNVVYFGGYDHKLHAFDADNGNYLWAYAGASAGYDTNPLVIPDNTGRPVVCFGNRDGIFYAIGGQGHPRQGQLIWRYDAPEGDGGIHFSPAYKDGIIYYASDDNYAYALNAQTGSRVWRSTKLSSDGYHSWWPVIYKDKLVLAGTETYRESRTRPNSGDSPNLAGNGVWPQRVEGTYMGPVLSPRSWSNGYSLFDAHSVTEAWEADPVAVDGKHLYWNRPMVALYLTNGQEYTYDSDGDGFGESLPFAWWTKPGATRYPPVVDSSGAILYAGGPFRCCSDAKGKVYGWTDQDPGVLSLVGTTLSSDGQPRPQGGWAAMAEPQALSGGGGMLYRSLCCDRVADWFSIQTPLRTGQLWSYSIGGQLPGYSAMWEISDGAISRHLGWYVGSQDFAPNSHYRTLNGQYHSHADNNPLIPYHGMIFTHRSNAIIAYGPGGGGSQLPLIPKHQGVDIVNTTQQELSSILHREVQQIVNARLLRPGYTTIHLHNYSDYADYFSHPAEALLTLSLAYPHLSPSLQTQVRTYLAQQIIPQYFDPTLYGRTGWADGVPRESTELPLDIQQIPNQLPKQVAPAGGIPLLYSAVALAKYAEVIPSVDSQHLYQIVKASVRVPIPQPDETNIFTRDPFIHNAWISSLDGFLKLQELAGMTGTDANLRQSVIQERERLLTLRRSLFTKDSPWTEQGIEYKKTLDLARNFLFMSPELAAYLRANLYNQVQVALTEYESVAPFWLVNRYEANFGESGSQSLYTPYAMFQAKAMILQETQDELIKYLDAPYWERGDLFYIQNLVATIEAPSSGTEPPPTPSATPMPDTDLDNDGQTDYRDFLLLIEHFLSVGPGDFNLNGIVDIFDFNLLVRYL
ncbi:hypothetical protein A2W24_04105 [Microgenomates group bacterium RBG_16_45_19]|nr:MAG: hypothetical protein A2W24_04105 [Microgenomates group bacterium RBG_16_45_19]